MCVVGLCVVGGLVALVNSSSHVTGPHPPGKVQQKQMPLLLPLLLPLLMLMLMLMRRCSRGSCPGCSSQ